MIELLEVPAIRRRVMKFSVEEYHRLPDGQPTELLEGTIIEKMSKSPLHYVTLQKLRRILDRQMRPDWDLRIEGPLTFTNSEPEPDAAIVLGSLESFGAAHPRTAELVIEIAGSSLEIVRLKGHIYAEAGVKEYWIVRPEEKCVEIFQEPGAQGYAKTMTVSTPVILPSTALDGVQVDLAELFA